MTRAARVTRYRAAIRLMDSPLRTVCVHTAGWGAVLGAVAVFGAVVFVPGALAEPQCGAGTFSCCEGATRLFRGLGWAWDTAAGDKKDGDEEKGDAETAAHGSNSA